MSLKKTTRRLQKSLAKTRKFYARAGRYTRNDVAKNHKAQRARLGSANYRKQLKSVDLRTKYGY